MFSKITAVLATAVATVSAQIPQWVNCDAQISCNQLLSQASNTTVTGSTCYGVYMPNKYSSKSMSAKGWPLQAMANNNEMYSGCFVTSTM